MMTMNVIRSWQKTEKKNALYILLLRLNTEESVLNQVTKIWQLFIAKVTL